MLVAGVIVLCIVLAILGFLVPRLSDHARYGTDKGFSTGARAGSRAPGPVGRFAKSFGTSQGAADKSHSAGKKPVGSPHFNRANRQTKPRSSS